jgi:hypothetical protein
LDLKATEVGGYVDGFWERKEFSNVNKYQPARFAFKVPHIPHTPILAMSA